MNPDTALVDRHGRLHTYMRVSVTDRCNFRCIYCMPAEGHAWLPRADVLSHEEIVRIVTVMAGSGLRRVRLTGGEPLLRRGLVSLVEAIAAVPGIDDLSMTTNAFGLAELAAPLRAAGLNRVNISIDSLDPARFSALTRGGKLAAVLDGIAAAHEAGLGPVKLNMVVMRGENDDEIVPLAEACMPGGVLAAPAGGRAAGSETVLRYIEYMPFQGRWHQNVPAREIRERLAEAGLLESTSAAVGALPGVGPATYARWTPHAGAGGVAVATPGASVRVGFIAPLTEHFCASCNRLRLLVDGHLRTCLGYEETPSLRDLLRGSEARPAATNHELLAAIAGIVQGKPAGHLAETEGGQSFEGVMTSIGG
ncbi:MAG: GTP 3',8-cyclase MoaA [Myxococcales bacterium]|nr:GTP 3',8-cyclase MoaA [Myxococcales bacterium]